MLRKLALALALTVGISSMASLASVATAQEQVTCKDGTMGKAGRGACSHHGGVARSVTAPSAPPAGAPPVAPAPVAPPPAARAPATQPSSKPPVAGQPTARCKDGSLSYSKHHTGSCSHHGGVSQWLE